MTYVDCEDDWSVVLPSIIGEDHGEKFTIEVTFGNVDKFVHFDHIKRTLTPKPYIKSIKSGVYFIEIRLINSQGASSLYGIAFDLTCDETEEDSTIDDSYTRQFSENPPTLYIDSVDQYGLVTIKSNTTMDPTAAFNTTELNYRMLNDDIVMIGHSEHVQSNYSMIQNSTVVLDQIELASIALNITYFEPEDDCSD